MNQRPHTPSPAVPVLAIESTTGQRFVFRIPKRDIFTPIIDRARLASARLSAAAERARDASRAAAAVARNPLVNTEHVSSEFIIAAGDFTAAADALAGELRGALERFLLAAPGQQRPRDVPRLPELGNEDLSQLFADFVAAAFPRLDKLGVLEHGNV